MLLRINITLDLNPKRQPQPIIPSLQNFPVGIMYSDS